MTFRELKIARRLHRPLPPNYEFWLDKLLETRKYSRVIFRRLMYVGTFMPFVFEASSDYHQTYNKIVLGHTIRIAEEHLLLMRDCDRKAAFSVKYYIETQHYLHLGEVFYHKKI